MDYFCFSIQLNLILIIFINLNLDNIPELQDISPEKMKIFCKICNIEIYKSGDIVNLTSGGILLRGTLFS